MAIFMLVQAKRDEGRQCIFFFREYIAMQIKNTFCFSPIIVNRYFPLTFRSQTPCTILVYLWGIHALPLTVTISPCYMSTFDIT